MSLYTSVAQALTDRGLLGSVGDRAKSALGSASGAAVQALGGSALAKRAVSIGASLGESYARGLVNKYIPPVMQRRLAVASGAAGDLMRGDWSAAGLRLLDSGLIDMPGFAEAVAAQARYFGTPTPLMGGITPAQARDIHRELLATELAHKNLWLIEVSSQLLGDESHRLNLFATQVEYSPYTIGGDKRKVGSAVLDVVQGSEHVELRLTTMDDAQGSVKRWFGAHTVAVAAQDGTVGVPARYAIKIRVLHAFVTTDSNRGGYEDTGLFRAANLDVSLSRQEQGMQEVAMTFSQLDTFMPIN